MNNTTLLQSPLLHKNKKNHINREYWKYKTSSIIRGYFPQYKTYEEMAISKVNKTLCVILGVLVLVTLVSYYFVTSNEMTLNKIRKEIIALNDENTELQNKLDNVSSKRQEVKELIKSLRQKYEDIDINMIYVMPNNDIDKKIREAEEILNIKLPESYLWFLRNYGSGGMEDFDYFGIECERDDVTMFTVVYMTMEYRKKGLNNALVVIEHNGDYVTCLDTSKRNSEGENPVVTWSWLDSGKIISKSDSFANYFFEKINDYI